MLTPESAGVQINNQTEIVNPVDQTSVTYGADFETGRIIGTVDGIDAVRQAIYLILQTERFSHLIYSWRYGVEMNTLIGRSNRTFESEIRRTIREALLADSRVLEITDMKITKTGARSTSVEFTAMTVFGEVNHSQEVIGNV